MKKILLIAALLLMTAPHAYAGLNVVATLPWIGSVAKSVGGDRVDVKTLVKPGQDPHYIEAKPSMILAVRDADVLMFNGLDLEIGYLPVLIESSRNALVQPGQPGNFDCSSFIRVLDKPTSVDRSMGDVHPLGNPHYHYSPSRVLKVAEGMAGELSRIDPAGAGYYNSKLKAFSAKMAEKRKQWAAVPLKGRRYVAYHRLFEYLASEFGFSITGYVEPKPGIPPSAGHIGELIGTMKAARPDGILVSAAYGKDEAESLSDRTGAPAIVLPNDVGSAKPGQDWFSFLDDVISDLR
ncbi:MAG: zinc ABC transporter substrate-binding protein [Nitrospirae bacterium]|nr:zinc ABC transporter substrate-binding protein [Nitrospirota bacterium]